MDEAWKSAALILEDLEWKSQIEDQKLNEIAKVGSTEEWTSFDPIFEFKNVTFSYANNKKIVLRNINLKIRKGESIGLVGESGSGKSTLGQLMMRFYDVEKG